MQKTHLLNLCSVCNISRCTAALGTYSHTLSMLRLISLLLQECYFCSFRSPDIASVIKHAETHSDISGFYLKCPYCPRKYTSIRYFREHTTINCTSRPASSQPISPSIPHPTRNLEENVGGESEGTQCDVDPVLSTNYPTH